MRSEALVPTVNQSDDRDIEILTQLGKEKFMEYKLLEENELVLMENVLNDDNMLFDIDYLKGFILNQSTYGFVAKEKDIIAGFAYGYTLLRPDGKTMFYLHSIFLG